MRLFIVNGQDYTRNIMVPSYAVNSAPCFEEWTDGNGDQHRDIYRRQIGGSFTVDFRTLAEYQQFIETIKAATTAAGYLPATVYINNRNETKDGLFFVDIAPENTMPLIGRAKHNGLVVNLSEV